MSIEPSSAGATYKLCPRCHNIYPADVQLCTRDGSGLVPDDRILVGKYILLRKIGEGSMGTVYEAEQPQIGRTVAVKVLRPDPEVMLRFEREVKAVGAINHANVVTIYDSGLTQDGRGFMAMEYLEGESLHTHLEQHGPLPPARAMELWIPAVRAMSAAHSKGIMHRDLKPENIFLSRRSSDEGTETVVKVLDFGIAKFKKGPTTGSRGTTPGMIVGTMQFMSPEQLEGAEADPRADVYALGLILVEMLTGRLPWGNTKEQGYLQFALRMVKPPTPLAELRPEQVFSPQLQQLVQDMLILEPKDRPAHAGVLVQRLKQVPEVAARGDMSDDRVSKSAIPIMRSGSGPIERGGTMVVWPSKLAANSALGLALRRNLPLLGFGLLVVALLGSLYLLRRSPRGQPGGQGLPDLAPSLPLAVVETAHKRVNPVDSASGPTTTKSGAGPHHLVHTSPVLQVQFAFMDPKGVLLTCGGTRLGSPDCAAGAVCKSMAMVTAGQRCVVEKGSIKKVYSYTDLQKNAPDRKNLIHVLVRFP